MQNTANKPVNVYAITKNGNALTDAGVDAATDMALNTENTPADATGALVHTGPDLLDPAGLATLLRDDPQAQLVFSSPDGSLILAGRVCDNGTPVEDILDDAAAHGVTSSWEAIAIAMGAA